MATSPTVETRDIVLATFLLALGVAAVVALGWTGMESPGFLSQDTAFLVLGGSVLVLLPSTFVLLYASKENRRQLSHHQEVASAKLEAVEGGIEAAVEGEMSPRLDQLQQTAREQRRAQQRQEKTLDRIEDLVEDEAETECDVRRRIEEIAEHQERLFSDIVDRQASAFADHEQQMRRYLNMEEARLVSLLERQERLLDRLEAGGSTASASQTVETLPEAMVSEDASEHEADPDRAPESGDEPPSVVMASQQAPADEADPDPSTGERPPTPLEDQLGEQTELLERILAAVEDPSGLDDGETPRRAGLVEERPRYPVAEYHVDEIPSLEASQARTLRAYGVNLTDTLLHTDLDRIAEATDLDRAQLQTWRDTAEIMALEGMGPELSARIVEVGIRSIDELAALDPEELSELLLETYDDRDEDSDVLVRTLPRRCEKVVDRARAAAMRLQHHRPA